MKGLANESFTPARPWVTATLQTLADRLRPRFHDLRSVGTEELRLIALPDSPGESLAVFVHHPHLGARPERPIVLVVPGLGGTSESTYVRAMTLGLLRAGYSVGRVDLRGTGASSAHTSSLNHGGRSSDLRVICGEIAREHVPGGVAVVGFSLGGNMALKLLGESLDGVPIRAGASVSAPLDLATTANWIHLRALGLYEKSFVHRLRVDTLASGVALSAAERDELWGLSTLKEFDDLITSRHHGWGDAVEYYRVNSSADFLPTISVPTLVVHALDDPMIPRSVYEAVDWQDLARRTPVSRAISEHGGHVGFHAAGQELPWFVRRIRRFLDDVA